MNSENGPSADSSSMGLARASAGRALNGHAVDVGLFGQELLRGNEEAKTLVGELLGRDTCWADDDALPPNEFLQQLKREKRRSERSRAPLSIVLYRID